MTKVYFVTGTDTDSGKTTSVAALMSAVKSKGFSVIGYKPVASGIEDINGFKGNKDILSIKENSSFDLSYEQCYGYIFNEAIAPHIAAIDEKVQIVPEKFNNDLDYLINHYHPDYVFIEGAGGWMLPLGEDIYMSEWVQDSNYSIIIVLGAKLGCLNHFVLTKLVIEHMGLDIAGYVINRPIENMDHYIENISWLKRKFPQIPCLGEIPYVKGLDKSNLGDYIDISKFCNDETKNS